MFDHTLEEREPTPIELLLSKGEEQGFVTLDDILEILPEAEEDTERLDDIYALLGDGAIQVLDVAPSVPLGTEDFFAEDREIPVDLGELNIDDTISLYLREVGHIPLLTSAQEIELAEKLKQGDLARRQLARDGGSTEMVAKLERQVQEGDLAREHLVKANSRLVISIAKKHAGRGVPLLDMIQEGNLGLIRAVEKFDPGKGYKLSTYATWWIRQAITRAIADQGRTIRLPVHMGEQIGRLRRVQRRLLQEYGREPTLKEIAKELGISPQKVERMIRVSQRPLSLEMSVGEEGDSSLGDFLEDNSTPLPTDQASLEMLREQIEQALSSLTPREARVLQLRYGLIDGYTHTLEEVGEKFGVTRERIRQIERQAIRRLQHPTRSKMLEDYLHG